MYRQFQRLFPLTCALGAIAVALAGGAAATPGSVRQGAAVPVMVSPTWLAAHLEDPDVHVLHVAMSHRPAAAAIPGAALLDYHAITVQQRDGLTIEMPPVDDLVAALRTAGVNRADHVIVYGAQPMHVPARAYVVLDYLGHERVSFLDGGLEGWSAAGFDVVASPRSTEPGDFVAAPRADVLATKEWIHERLGGASMVLVDARPANEYAGGRRGGHIPGAANIYWPELLQSESLPLLDLAEAERRYGAAGADGSATVVSYCYIGMRASYTYVVSKHLGFETRFYDGSWDEWSRDAALPVETGADPRGR